MPRERPARVILPAMPAALRISDLRFTYPGAAEPVVDIAEFQLAPGEQVLLTGGSGSGKSTLLQLIAGLMDPDAGEIEIAGTRVDRLRGSARDLFRGRHVGMIFQTFNLLPGFSAMENVMAAMMFSGIPAGEHRPRAAALLRRLGIERIDAEPDRLSVGQQQRVAVARALACGPALVLADEPTASLDPENAGEAIGLIQEVCRERDAALLCVSHDPSMASRFTRRETLAGLSGRSAAPARTHAATGGAAR